MARPSGRARSLIEALHLRCTFPPPGSPLDCAVSGGADSTALLVLATAAGCVVTAHHVDHGLRPGSAAEAELVAGFAERFGAEFVAHRVGVDDGPNLEARARDARYRALPARVATGHTLDDRAETMLINLLRGASRRGLAPMTDDDRHPIRRLRRHETTDLCAVLELATVDDPTNRDPRFLRNRVRHELVPLLDELAQRDVAPVLDRQADLLGDEDRFLDAAAAALDPTDAGALAAADPVLARRAVRRFVTDTWTLGHPPSGAAVERILEVARGDAVSCDIEGGHRAHRTRGRLRIEPPSLG